MIQMITPGMKCFRCGDEHPITKCPHVKAIEFSPDNDHIVRVEFLTPIDFPRQQQGEQPEPDYARFKPSGMQS